MKVFSKSVGDKNRRILTEKFLTTKTRGHKEGSRLSVFLRGLMTSWFKLRIKVVESETLDQKVTKSQSRLKVIVPSLWPRVFMV